MRPSDRKPRHYRTKFGQGREDYLRQQEEEEEKKVYLRSLETTLPSRVIEALSDMDEKNIDLNLILSLLRYICSSMDDGAVLIFLPGWDSIIKLYDILQANPVFRSSQYLTIPLHSMIPTAFQQQVHLFVHLLVCLLCLFFIAYKISCVYWYVGV